MVRKRLFIASDLHAMTSNFAAADPDKAPPAASEGKPSWLDYSDRRDDRMNPMRLLRDQIARRKTRADYLVVPGDLCDKANGDALRAVWSDLQSVRSDLQATAIIATAGNHDLDSRYTRNSYDPKVALKALTPRFPLGEQARWMEYWAVHVARFDDADIRVVVVNSCAYHGGNPSELRHGRFSEEMLGALRENIQAEPKAAINVLLCHHHPHPFVGTAGSFDDRMKDGQLLLEALDDSGTGWLIVHGHRHEARLEYAAGSSKSPVVLAAASMSARIQPQWSGSAENQVHLLDIIAEHDSDELRGTIESWSFTPGIGWHTTSVDSAFPPRCGFGYRGSIDALARRVAERVFEEEGPVKSEQLEQEVSDLLYLTPKDQARLVARAPQFGIAFTGPISSLYEVAPI